MRDVHCVARLARAVLALAFLSAAQAAVAQQYPAGSPKGVPGEEMYKVCSFCHGPQGQGGQALDAPPLAGREAWYVERQLHAFQARQRGMHPADVPGLQMSIASGMARNAATIANVAAYIEALPPGGPVELVNGKPADTHRPFIWRSRYAQLNPVNPADAAKGAALYKANCLACHGDRAQGNKDLGAPGLLHNAAWYLERETQYFRDGIRGADPKDIFGQQMAAAAKALADEQAIADVVAYIQSL